jgi:hypothetical protein
MADGMGRVNDSVAFKAEVAATSADMASANAQYGDMRVTFIQ